LVLDLAGQQERRRQARRFIRTGDQRDGTARRASAR
jgi:hypothetical protein